MNALPSCCRRKERHESEFVACRRRFGLYAAGEPDWSSGLRASLLSWASWAELLLRRTSPHRSATMTLPVRPSYWRRIRSSGSQVQSGRGLRGGRPHCGTIGVSSTVPSRVATVVALLRARPEVKQVLDYANNSGGSTMISKDGDFTVVVATVGAVQEKQAVAALQHAIAAQPSLKGNAWLGGPTVADVQIAAVSSQDLGRAELVALPFLILLLFFVFRGLLAAAVPLIGAVFAIATTLGVMGVVILGCRYRSLLSIWSSPSDWVSRSTSVCSSCRAFERSFAGRARSSPR